MPKIIGYEKGEPGFRSGHTILSDGSRIPDWNPTEEERQQLRAAFVETFNEESGQKAATYEDVWRICAESPRYHPWDDTQAVGLCGYKFSKRTNLGSRRDSDCRKIMEESIVLGGLTFRRKQIAAAWDGRD